MANASCQIVRESSHSTEVVIQLTILGEFTMMRLQSTLLLVRMIMSVKKFPTQPRAKNNVTKPGGCGRPVKERGKCHLDYRI